MWRFLSVFVLIVLIPLPGWCYPQYDLPRPTDVGTIPIPVSSNPGTLALPDAMPDFFDAVWIVEYNDAISKGIDEETAQLKAYSEWHELNTDPAIFIMTKPMQEAVKQAGHTKTGKTANKVYLGGPSKPDYSLKPRVLYDGSNTDAVSTDINEQRALIYWIGLKPEEILALYGVPTTTSAYRLLFTWIEEHLYQGFHEAEAIQNYWSTHSSLEKV
jgi:hypothetical protein